MTPALALLAILGTLALGAMSPGPSFVLVARTAVARSRHAGLAAALGMGLGGAIFCSLALLGLIALLASVEWLYALLKIGGALYLFYLAIMIWRGAGQALRIEPDGAGETRSARERPLRRSFLVGLMTQLSNPKTAIVYSGIFAALLPPAPPAWMVLALPPLIFSIEAGWYAIVALLFSADRPRRAYLGGKRWFDRAAGTVIGFLGLKLALEAARAS
jgi:threonine/homoserine/homoserine lactone efflux protein